MQNLQTRSIVQSISTMTNSVLVESVGIAQGKKLSLSNSDTQRAVAGICVISPFSGRFPAVSIIGAI